MLAAVPLVLLQVSAVAAAEHVFDLETQNVFEFEHVADPQTHGRVLSLLPYSYLQDEVSVVEQELYAESHYALAPLQLAVPQLQGRVVFLAWPTVFAQVSIAVELQVFVSPTHYALVPLQLAVPQLQGRVVFLVDPSVEVHDPLFVFAEQVLVEEVQKGVDELQFAVPHVQGVVAFDTLPIVFEHTGFALQLLVDWLHYP